jgi:hypothetical protein
VLKRKFLSIKKKKKSLKKLFSKNFISNFPTTQLCFLEQKSTFKIFYQTDIFFLSENLFLIFLTQFQISSRTMQFALCCSLVYIRSIFSNLAGKSKDEAMNDYITKVKQLLEEAGASA